MAETNKPTEKQQNYQFCKQKASSLSRRSKNPMTISGFSGISWQEQNPMTITGLSGIPYY